jgi:hypothetical protein
MTTELTQRCTWRPLLFEVQDALGGHDTVNLEAVNERLLKFTWEATTGQCWSPSLGKYSG